MGVEDSSPPYEKRSFRVLAVTVISRCCQTTARGEFGSMPLQARGPSGEMRPTSAEEVGLISHLAG